MQNTWRKGRSVYCCHLSVPLHQSLLTLLVGLLSPSQSQLNNRLGTGWIWGVWELHHHWFTALWCVVGVLNTFGFVIVMKACSHSTLLSLSLLDVYFYVYVVFVYFCESVGGSSIHLNLSFEPYSGPRRKDFGRLPWPISLSHSTQTPKRSRRCETRYGIHMKHLITEPEAASQGPS